MIENIFNHCELLINMVVWVSSHGVFDGGYSRAM